MAKKPAKKATSDNVLAPDQVKWREPNGNFKLGNPGGPGRAFVRQERFLLAINEAVTPVHWNKIIKKAIEQAIDGDRHAREFLAKWLMGQPDAVQDEHKSTIIDVLTEGNFVKWIEEGRHNGNGNGRTEE